MYLYNSLSHKKEKFVPNRPINLVLSTIINTKNIINKLR